MDNDESQRQFNERMQKQWQASVENAKKMWWVNTRTGVRSTQSPFFDATILQGINTYKDSRGDIWTKGG